MNLAYVAGIVDGEGCLCFSRTRNHFFPKVLVSNTRLELLEDLKKEFGGDIRPMKRKLGWKQSYNWRISNSSAVNFIDRIQKWLRLKDKQAVLFFLWDSIRPGYSGEWNEETKSALRFLVDQCHWLNKRGCNNSEEPVKILLKDIPCH